MSQTARVPMVRLSRWRRRLLLGLVALLLVAYAVALVVRRAQIAEEDARYARAEAAVRRLGGEVPRLQEYSLLDPLARPSSVLVDFSKVEVGDDDLAALDGFPERRPLQLTLGRTRLTDAGLARLVARHPGLITLHLGRENRREDWHDRPEAAIHDSGLAHLAGLKRLGILGLHGVPITDAGLRHLAGLRELGVLELDDTDIGDEGLAALGGMTSLRWVFLSRTRVTDAGLIRLAGLPNLELIKLTGTRTTAEGRRRFQEARPKVQIEFQPGK